MEKIVLAVHGIGDQTRNETIMATGARFRGFYSDRSPLSLGEFHRALEDGRPPFALCDMGFAEIYWADIPRRVAAAGYTLQETKAWARSVVERVEAVGAHRLAGVDYDLVKDVVEEMITTITVIEALLFLAKKAGILDFNLKKLLDDYIGDVQIVVEFADLRAQVLARFETMLQNAQGYSATAEIYLVTHSEGTVVALMALLDAASSPAPPIWLKQIRGFMTLGSPISKHLVLWPGLFAQFQGLSPGAVPQPIPWMNYYDRGDPVGFELDIARDWLAKRGYGGLFDFPKENDIGFSRYYLPGKAHTDYWGDAAVFDHFIAQVVAPGSSPARRPRSIPAAQVFSYVVPYVLFGAVTLAGVYVLYRGIGMVLDLHGSANSHITTNVSALTAALAGTTAGLRISRLTKSFGWVVLAVLILLASVALYHCLVTDSPELSWLAAVPMRCGVASAPKGVILGGLGTACLAVFLSDVDQLVHRWMGGRRWFRFFGAMIFTGALALLVTAVFNFLPQPDRAAAARVWPLLLSGAGFVYIWWLSALLFDLVFVWHRYIRSSLVVKVLANAPNPGVTDGRDRR
jgi:hypothetical protein